MKRFDVSRSLSTGLGLPSALHIDVGDAPIGQGGFGAVYKVERIDGHATRPLVLKLLFDAQPGTARRGFDTIQELQSRLTVADRRLRAGGVGLLDRFPALAAVPTLSVEGMFDGKAALGYLAPDLVALGYEDFGALLDDPANLRAYQSQPLDAKLARGLQLVEAFEFLSSQIGYIHADIKAEALFIDRRRPRLAIIDFDSGAVPKTPTDRPTTFGTKQDWLAPEISKQLDHPGNVQRVIHVDLFSDVWSVNVALHYLIFGFSPYFFFSEVSDRSIDAYRRFSWPQANRTFPFFRSNHELAHRTYLAWSAAHLPREINRRLAVTFGEGYRTPAARTSYGQWRTVLGTRQVPSIVKFSVDRTLVDDLRPVKVTWEVAGAAAVTLTGQGAVTGRTEADVRVTKDTVLTLTVVPAVGKPLSKSITIAVSKVPPTIARFAASSTSLDRQPEVELSWEVRGPVGAVQISGLGRVPAQGQRRVTQRSDMTYVLTATSPFGGVAKRQVAVRVSRAAPVVRQLAAMPLFPIEGQPMVITWSVDGAERVQITGLSGDLPPSGRAKVVAGTQPVVLRAWTAFGVIATQALRLNLTKRTPLPRAMTIGERPALRRSIP